MASTDRLKGVSWEGEEPYIEVAEGVRLTPIRETDVDMYVRHWNEPKVNGKPASETPFIERAQAVKVIARQMGSDGPTIQKLRAGQDALDSSPFGIIRSHPEGRMMGIIGMHNSRHPLPPPAEPSALYPWTNTTVDVWYNMHPDYAGKGRTKAAAKGVVEKYMGPVMRLSHVGAGVNVDHVASRAILRGAGFEEVFRYERHRPGVSPIPRIKMVRKLDQGEWDGAT